MLPPDATGAPAGRCYTKRKTNQSDIGDDRASSVAAGMPAQTLRFLSIILTVELGSSKVHPSMQGLRVVVLAEGVAPAFAGRWLAAFGADVIVVEPPGGHWIRRFAPSGAAVDGDSGPLSTFLYAGASSVILDRERADDRASLRELLARSDVLLHDLSPAGLARWALETATLRREQPRLVQVALTPFGSEGPYGGFS